MNVVVVYVPCYLQHNLYCGAHGLLQQCHTHAANQTHHTCNPHRCVFNSLKEQFEQGHIRHGTCCKAQANGQQRGKFFHK